MGRCIISNESTLVKTLLCDDTQSLTPHLSISNELKTNTPAEIKLKVS